MKHFIIFLGLIFSALLIIFLNTESQKGNSENKVIKVFADTSFVSKWGPGPALATLFQKQNNIKVDFVESPDAAMTLQKMAFEGKNAMADVIVGLDQFDLARSSQKIKWKEIRPSSKIEYVAEIASLTKEINFLAIDWAPMAFVTRQNVTVSLEKLDDLLKPEFRGKIALEDPRTSSPGLQFLVWVFETKSIPEARNFLKALNRQVHSYSSGWSAAYGLFKSKQVETVFSYVTSPIYHLVEEKDSTFISLEFKEPHPVQVEFVGVPDNCKNCDSAIRFAQFLQTDEAQKILMTKNYMLPVVSRIKESTVFDSVKVYRTNPFKVYDKSQLDEWIQIWSEIRKNEGT